MKKSLYIILALLLPTVSFAQISFKAFGKNYVRKNEQFYVRYTLRGPEDQLKNPEFSYPNTDDFEILNINRSVSTSTSVQIINGKISYNAEKSITWAVSMYAKKEGTFTLPPATVKIGDKTYKSNSLQIVVEDNPNNPLPKPKQNPYLANNQDNDENLNFKPSKDYSLILSANKKVAYLGEPIYFTVKILSKSNLDILDFKPSSFDGFWIQNFPQSQTIKPNKTRINGKTYLIATLEKKLLFPQKVGNLEIKPYFIKIQTYTIDPFFYISVPGDIKSIYSNALNIKIKPLPEQGKPVNFSGAVGNFDISIQIEKQKFNIDEPLTIKLIIKGSGNFGLFDDPKINLPNSFEQMPVQTSDNLNLTINGLSGQKIYQFSFIPRSPGKYTIPSISFSYFDPKQKKYFTKKTNPIEIEITGTLDSTKAYAYSSAQSLEQLANDIQYIETQNIRLVKKDDFLCEKAFFKWLYILFIGIFVAAVFITKKYQKLTSDVKKFNFINADKIALKYLKKAKKYLTHKDVNNFYLHIDKALTEYASKKFDIPLKEFTLDKLKEKFAQINIDEKLAKDYTSLIVKSQAVRYANQAFETNLEQDFEKAKKLITEIEKNF